MTLNQQNQSIIIISDPKNLKNEVLNKTAFPGAARGGHIEYRDLRLFREFAHLGACQKLKQYSISYISAKFGVYG